MKHNIFNLNRDVIQHIKQFLEIFIQHDQEIYENINDDLSSSVEEYPLSYESAIHFPIFMYTQPYA
jgi:hypothetical protein